MLLAEVSGETAIGAGVFSLLGILCVQVFRRQSDTDAQRQQIAQMAVTLHSEQLARAYAERDRANAERDAERSRAERLEMELAVERARKEEEAP